MKKTGKKFSIVVPAYNVGTYLGRCIDSIVHQSYQDWECICVDDGSSDASGVILDEYAKTEARIRVIHSENAGVVEARRKGLCASRGAWVWFVDGDDYICDDALEYLAGIIERYEPSLIKFNFDRIYDKESACPNTDISLEEQFEDTECLMNKIKSTPIEITGMCVWDKVYNRDVAIKAMGKIGHVRIKHSEDGLFAVAALFESESVISTGRVLYHYVQREGSALNQCNPQIVTDKMMFIEAMSFIFKASRFYDEAKHDRMVARLAHDGIMYILTSLCKWPMSVRQIFTISKELRSSGIILLAKSEQSEMFRRWLFVVCAYCPILIVVQRLRMSVRSRLSGRG